MKPLQTAASQRMEDDCMHHWLLRSYEDASGTTPATCKHCGVTRDFTSAPPRLALLPARKASAPRA